MNIGNDGCVTDVLLKLDGQEDLIEKMISGQRTEGGGE